MEFASQFSFYAMPQIYPRQPTEILILKEYERVYDDMEWFFSGQTPPFLTPFDEEDTLWARWEMDLIAESEDPDTAPDLPAHLEFSVLDFPDLPGPPLEQTGHIVRIVASLSLDNPVSGNPSGCCLQ